MQSAFQAAAPSAFQTAAPRQLAGEPSGSLISRPAAQMASIDEIQRLLRGQKEDFMSGLDERLGALKASLKEELKADLERFIEAKIQKTSGTGRISPPRKHRKADGDDRDGAAMSDDDAASSTRAGSTAAASSVGGVRRATTRRTSFSQPPRSRSEGPGGEARAEVLWVRGLPADKTEGYLNKRVTEVLALISATGMIKSRAGSRVCRVDFDSAAEADAAYENFLAAKDRMPEGVYITRDKTREQLAAGRRIGRVRALIERVVVERKMSVTIKNNGGRIFYEEADGESIVSLVYVYPERVQITPKAEVQLGGDIAARVAAAIAEA